MKKNNLLRLSKNPFIISFFLIASLSPAAQKFVAVDGNDTNPGTIDKPFKSISAAVLSAAPGDTIFVRGGTYTLTTAVSISSSKSGTAEEKFHLFAYPGERPLLDFSGEPMGAKGISLKAGFWHVKGFDVKGAGDNGMEISGGSNNLIENCSFFENRDSGLQLSNGASNNRIVNCDAYYNADPPDYADADGFAPKLAVGTGNAFEGCRSWGNCDDGWDGYLRGATDVTTTLENCWSWGNGFLKDGTDPGSQANGNGFKMGGGDKSNSQGLEHHFILKNCLAFGNKNKGFDQNHNAGSMTLLNCTGYQNRAADYRIAEALNPGRTLVVKNCVSLGGGVELGGFAVQQNNSWMPPLSAAATDFLSLDASAASAPRKADGNLPDMAFMHLAEGSILVDAGVFVGIPFYGRAPDLGAFESAWTSIAQKGAAIPSGFAFYTNYPNPLNSETILRFRLPEFCFITLTVFDAMGRESAALARGFFESGEHRIAWRSGDLPGGVYLCRLQAGGMSASVKMVVQK